MYVVPKACQTMILYDLSYKKLRKLVERANLYEKTYNRLVNPSDTPIFIRKIVQLPRYYYRMHNSCTKFRIKLRLTSFNLALALMSSASLHLIRHAPFLTAYILLLVPTPYLATCMLLLMCYCLNFTVHTLLLAPYALRLTAHILRHTLGALNQALTFSSCGQRQL